MDNNSNIYFCLRCSFVRVQRLYAVVWRFKKDFRWQNHCTTVHGRSCCHYDGWWCMPFVRAVLFGES